MTDLPAHLSIRIRGLGKRYRIGSGPSREDSLAGAVARAVAAPVRNFRTLRRLTEFESDDGPDVVWALRDVDLEVARGEVVGVVGRNGAGKTTLLKILSQVTEPTRGRVDVRGRVASLLEVGTGFHPDLTGRDNVFLNGSMHGMTRHEIERRFDEIVEFAEIEQFIDTPVKRYSSGMYVRLAFAVAAHLDPDVLLTDEVLAVGDAAFQSKCLGRMREVAGAGRTVIFVSHNHAAVASLCSRAIWLDEGSVAADGTVADVTGAYFESLEVGREGDLSMRRDREGDGRLRITNVGFRDSDGASVDRVRAGEILDVVLGYATADGRPARHITVLLFFDDRMGQRVLTVSNEFTGDALEAVPPRGAFVCTIPSVPLNDGEYVCSVKVRVGGGVADRLMHAARFRVDASAFYAGGRHPGPDSGPLVVEHAWRVTGADTAGSDQDVVTASSPSDRAGFPPTT